MKKKFIMKKISESFLGAHWKKQLGFLKIVQDIIESNWSWLGLGSWCEIWLYKCIQSS